MIRELDASVAASPREQHRSRYNNPRSRGRLGDFAGGDDGAGEDQRAVGALVDAVGDRAGAELERQRFDPAALREAGLAIAVAVGRAPDRSISVLVLPKASRIRGADPRDRSAADFCDEGGCCIEVSSSTKS
jgi:hypothetical protein